MNLLKECSKHHEKAKGKVDVQCLHVGYLWQSPRKNIFDNSVDFKKIRIYRKLPIDSPHECDHGEDCGDAKPNPRGGRATVQIKTHLHTQPIV